MTDGLCPILPNSYNSAETPQESFALLNVLFADPPARYPIMALVLRVFSSKISLPPILSFSRSTFLDSFFTSLLVDKSAALFEREMVTLLIIMPYMAVYTPVRLREVLPTLLATLSRAICWKQRSAPRKEDDDTMNGAEMAPFVGRPSPSNVFVDNEDPGPYAGNVIVESTASTPQLKWVVTGLSISSQL